jgi:hypothetical protein
MVLLHRSDRSLNDFPTTGDDTVDRLLLIHSVAPVLFATAPSKACRSAA